MAARTAPAGWAPRSGNSLSTAIAPYFSATLEAVDPPVLGAEMVFYDVTTGHTDNMTGAAYTGPVAGLTHRTLIPAART